ncbi:phage portal protein [Actinomadura sp. K4S16]|uniref:phage portal protein n=1 Tax=Actinomadura sp. K4S16 TaxID=1316147 RepID=UPI0011EEAF87|nr:phage portal protein [Actinomadura sp. K4S16]
MAGTTDLTTGLEQLDKARADYDEAEDFYEGNVDEIFTTAKVRRLLAKARLDKLRDLNFAKTPVDKVVSRLKITGLTALTPAGDPDEEAQADLEATWRRNNLGVTLHDLIQHVSTYRDGYLFVWPSDPADDEEAGTPDTTAGTEDASAVDVLINDPRTVTVVYSEENPGHALYAVKKWCSDPTKGREVHQARVYYRDRIERYQSAPGSKGADAEDWTKQGDDLDNPYGRLPVFHLNIPRPEHYWAYTPQLIINKIVLMHLATVDHLSFKQRYGLQDPRLDDISGGADFDEDHPDDDDPENEDNEVRLRSDPGDFWHLKGYSGVGEFSASEPGNFLDPLNFYIRCMAQLTDTPLHYFDPTGNLPSGESLKVADAPLTDKIDNRKERYTARIEAAAEFILRVLGHDDVRVVVDWGPSGTETETRSSVDLELDRASKVIAMLNELAAAVVAEIMTPQDAKDMISRLMDLVSGDQDEKKGIAA